MLIKVFLLGKACKVVLQSSKHEEMSFPDEFIFVFSPYFIGYFSSCQKLGTWKKKGRVDHIGELSIEGGLNFLLTMLY